MKDRLRETENDVKQAINALPHSIAIFMQTIAGDGELVAVYQWKSNTGESFSPEFTDLTECQKYSQSIGLKLQ